jgi:membrane-bound lytic murein transglycosylase D
MRHRGARRSSPGGTSNIDSFPGRLVRYQYHVERSRSDQLGREESRALMHRRGRAAGLGVILSVLVSTWAAPAAEARAVAVPRAVVEPAAKLEDDLFPRSPRLEQRIAFWTSIFTRYGESDVVIHDARYVEKIYAVLSLRGASRRRIGEVAAAERDRIRALLHGLDRKRGAAPSELDGRERAIYDLFRDVDDPRKFREAAGRVRTQAGLREQFAEGIRVSRRYLPEMERVFRDAGLPVELTRLPLIESCFNLRAYSFKGAAGVWQFMPRTGRLNGLWVDRLVDERRDPLRATHAAARYMATAHRALGNWPLAITAYNHGANGIARGVRAVGSDDIADLVERYQSRSFGFAGQNFYAEFVAALEIDQDPERYFGPLGYQSPEATEDVPLRHALTMEAAARAAGVSREVLAAHNPALSSHVTDGRTYIPKGYRLRVPAGRGDAFEAGIAALAEQRAPGVAIAAGTHTMRHGQTLSHVAREYGTSVAALEGLNGIRDARRVRAGQVIRIPGDSQNQNTRVAEPLPAGGHRVRRGETLSGIARNYGVSIGDIERANGIRDARRLRVGQVLDIPGQAVVATAAPGATVVEEGGVVAPTAQVVAAPEPPAEPAPTERPSSEAMAMAEPATAGGGREEPAIEMTVAPTEVVAADEAAAGGAESDAPTVVSHEVQPGETLAHIARRHGVSVADLQQHNGIADPRRMRAGTIISVPSATPAAEMVAAGAPRTVAEPAAVEGRQEAPEAEVVPEPTEVVAADEAAADGVESDAPAVGSHEVQPGETLVDIARQHGVSVADLQEHNGIMDPRRMRAGTIISVPSAAPVVEMAADRVSGTVAEPAAMEGRQEAPEAEVVPEPTEVVAADEAAADGVESDAPAVGSHEVQPGETLVDIARRHGVSVADLQEHNGITDPRRMRAGTIIRVPSAAPAVEMAAAGLPGTVAEPAAMEGRQEAPEAEVAAEPTDVVAGGVESDAPAVVSHEVRPGETLVDIARQHGVSVADLREDNEIADPRRIRPGQQIVVRESTELSPQSQEGARGTVADPQAIALIAQARVPDPGAQEPVTPAPLDVTDVVAAPSAVVQDATDAAGVDQAGSGGGHEAEVPVAELTTEFGEAQGDSPEDDSVLGVGASEEGDAALDPEDLSEVVHRVAGGQTLTQIASRYGVSVQVLKEENGISDAREMRAGQIIRIPGGFPDDGYVRHQVRDGQTLSQIAREYGVSVGDLKRHNGIRDARRLREGQMIRIPTGEQAATRQPS